MTAPKERSIGLMQFLTISAVFLFGFIGWDFGHRVLSTVDLLQQDAQAQVRLANATRINQQLKDLQTLIRSDSWIEQYVRIKWHWERDGDTMFVPISTPAAPQNTPPPAPPPAPVKPGWRQWLDNLINAIFGPPS